jgi:3-hydroxyisobutyrate dehydrogenase-like beta-hydroxyacid dehydrogenase
LAHHETLGFIGLGRMGLPMASRLARSGRTVLAYDARSEARGLAHEAGVTTVANLVHVAQRSDAVLVSVPDPAAVERVVLGADGLSACCRPGSVIVDLSTSSPGLARMLATEGAARDIAVLDAPVSGGPARAATGDLIVMVGGAEEPVRRMLPVL